MTPDAFFFTAFGLLILFQIAAVLAGIRRELRRAAKARERTAAAMERMASLVGLLAAISVDENTLPVVKPAVRQTPISKN